MFDTQKVSLKGTRTAALGPPELEFIFHGYDFRDADFRMEIRDRRDGGQVRASLGKVATASAEGLRVADYRVIDGLPVTSIHGRINETTMEQMPMPDPGEDTVLTWGMHITPAGGLKFQPFEGEFIVLASSVAP